MLRYEQSGDRALSFRFTDAVIFVISLKDKNYLEDLIQLYEAFVDARGDKEFGILLVGNKGDLKSEGNSETSADIDALVSAFKCGYVETSAKTGNNVDYAFFQAAKSYLDVAQIRDVKEPKEKKKCNLM
jgi:GTPase SAR1 family protein